MVILVALIFSLLVVILFLNESKSLVLKLRVGHKSFAIDYSYAHVYITPPFFFIAAFRFCTFAKVAGSLLHLEHKPPITRQGLTRHSEQNLPRRSSSGLSA